MPDTAFAIGRDAEDIVVEKSYLVMTSTIVSAYVRRATLPAGDMPGVIAAVFGALRDLGTTEGGGSVLQPAVPIEQSVHAGFIVCLEDGKKLKMLKRHLRHAYGLTPEAYREKWGLPKDYPMVAPSYAARRSALAKQMGLGKLPR